MHQTPICHVMHALICSQDAGSALRLSSGSLYLGLLPAEVSRPPTVVENIGFVGCIDKVRHGHSSTSIVISIIMMGAGGFQCCWLLHCGGSEGPAEH